jgi:hypothetical protein
MFGADDNTHDKVSRLRLLSRADRVLLSTLFPQRRLTLASLTKWCSETPSGCCAAGPLLATGPTRAGKTEDEADDAIGDADLKNR